MTTTRTPFAVYQNPRGPLTALFVEADHAAAFVAVLGDGAVVRLHGAPRTTAGVLWTEGDAGDGSAGESYDLAAEKMHERLNRIAAALGVTP